jgi:hypothetical protein
LKAQVRAFQNCKWRDDLECTIQDEIGKGDGWWLKFDNGDSTDVQTLRCVIIGRKWSKPDFDQGYYILVVAPTFSEGHKTFERIGVGFIPKRSILQIVKASADIL